jgi:PBP1b-binding outer membrane lipoprotein LpoB
MKSIKIIALSIGLVSMLSCSRSVTRVSPDQQIDLSGRWNDTDSKMVAAEMIKDVLQRPWREDFASAEGRKPVMVVGIVEREFINSGTIRVVQNSMFREKMREERAEQGEFASPETQAQWGKELGADFMLFGVITSITDSYKKEKVVSYKINLELANLETNEKVWIGDKEIKKYIKN